jgi:hypothetical protein
MFLLFCKTTELSIKPSASTDVQQKKERRKKIFSHITKRTVAEKMRLSS